MSETDSADGMSETGAADGTWTGFQSLAGNTNASPIAVSATSSVSVFVRGSDNALWHGRFTSSGWSGFESLGGSVAATDALAT